VTLGNCGLWQILLQTSRCDYGVYTTQVSVTITSEAGYQDECLQSGKERKWGELAVMSQFDPNRSNAGLTSRIATNP